MPEDDRRERPLTQSEVEEIINRSRRQDISERRTAVLHGMELKLAELIGTDGDGGEFAAYKGKVDSMSTRLETVELFKNRAVWTISLLSIMGGAVTGIVLFVVERLLSK